MITVGNDLALSLEKQGRRVVMAVVKTKTDSISSVNRQDTLLLTVNLHAATLNSNDCFGLFTPQSVYIWCGKGSTGNEREVSKVVGSSKSK